MSNDSNLPERVSALEKALAGRSWLIGNQWFWAAAAGVMVAGLLTANLWLLNRTRADDRQAALAHHFWVVGHAAYSPAARADSFLALALAGNKEWRGAHLDGLELEGVKLNGADIQEADFRYSKLAGASLVAARLNKCKLQQTDFTEADLSGASLAGADMFRAVLKRVELRRANLRGISLHQVEAQEASLVTVQLADSYLLMANFTGANLSGADLTGANLEAAILKGANLSLARLTSANVKDTDFTDSNWWHARGLSAEQIAQLTARFAPTTNAPAAVREDFDAWKKIQGTKNTESR